MELKRPLRSTDDGRTAVQWREGVSVIAAVYWRTPAQQAFDRRATWCGRVYNYWRMSVGLVRQHYRMTELD